MSSPPASSPTSSSGRRSAGSASGASRRSGADDAEEVQRRLAAFVAAMRLSPIALETRAANEQHYEVPPAFFELVLGTP